MGLAERFKDKLDKRDIFKKYSAQVFNDKNIMFISTPETTDNPTQTELIKNNKNIDTLETEVIQPVTNIMKTPEIERYPLEDLETQIIAKIRKTPYWSEYSIQQQEQMINRFLDKKASDKTTITDTQRTEFIHNIIILTNKS